MYIYIYKRKLKLRYLKTFLQNAKYIWCRWIQSFLIALAQPLCCSILLAAHLWKKKCCIKHLKKIFKRLSWHLGSYHISSEMVLTVKVKKSQTSHFSAESQTLGYSAVTVFCLYSFSFLVLGFRFLCQCSPKCLSIHSLIFSLHFSVIFFIFNSDTLVAYLNPFSAPYIYKTGQKNTSRKTSYFYIYARNVCVLEQSHRNKPVLMVF